MAYLRGLTSPAAHARNLAGVRPQADACWQLEPCANVANWPTDVPKVAMARQAQPMNGNEELPRFVAQAALPPAET